MTNKFAITWLKENYTTNTKPKELALMYAMDDIIHDDIEIWLKEPLYSHLNQFIDISKEVIQESRQEGMSCDRIISAAMNVSESMLEYSKIYSSLNSANSFQKKYQPS